MHNFSVYVNLPVVEKPSLCHVFYQRMLKYAFPLVGGFAVAHSIKANDSVIDLLRIFFDYRIWCQCCQRIG